MEAPPEEIWKPQFPLARIKQIMKLDPKVNVTLDGVYAVTVCTQLFLELLTMESYNQTKQSQRKTIQYMDVSQTIQEVHEFEFLTELVPLQIPFEDAMERRQVLMEQLQQQKEL
jgi:histone H3/H4